MVNNFAINKGFALLELMVVTLIVGLLLATIISSGMNSINRSKFQATVREMGSIAQASIDYYNSSNNPNDLKSPQELIWPADTSLLANNIDSSYNNMPQVVSTNPFGFS